MPLSGDSAYRSGRNLAILPSIGGRWAAHIGNVDQLTEAGMPGLSGAALFGLLLLLATAAGSSAQTPSIEANKTLVRELFAAFQAGDAATLNRIFGPVEHFHGPSGAPETRTPDAQALEKVCPLCAALNPRIITIDQIVAEGDLVAVRSTWSGTFSGVFRGATVKSKPVKVTIANIYRVSGGHISENWAIPDVSSLEKQLGFTVSPPQD